MSTSKAVLNPFSSPISRRAFLQSSGLAASGLLVNIAMPPGVMASSPGVQFSPNAFIHIAAPSGDTTLYCGRCEMGQGISTTLPAAVADELEADWSRVRVLQGDANEKYGPQGTGGSQSINKMFEPMRKAGAAGKEMLIAAAAQMWHLTAQNCYAKNHFIYNNLDDRKLSYGELAALAGSMEVPAEPILKTRDEFRYIGKPLQRHDQGDVVVGRRTYGADVKTPGMKYAAVRHVPVYGGTLKSLDKTAALAMPGVVDVVEIPRFENAYGSVGAVGVVADNTWTAQ